MRKVERDVLLKKIDEWRDKALLEQDSFNRYLSIFIAFNIFYNLFKKTKKPHADLTFGDSERVIETQALIDTETLFQTLKPELKEYIEFIPIYREEYWGRQRGTPISETLTQAFNQGDSKTSVEMLLKWLYKVRCNLIHGVKDYDDNQQRKLLAQSSSLLARVLSHSLEAYKQTYVHGNKRNLFTD